MAETARIVVICTANQCRSPLGAAVLQQRIAALGIDASVTSAGVGAVTGMPATRQTIDAGRRIGLDLSGHSSTLVDVASLTNADLVLGMERRHVQETVVLAPSSFPHTFTLKELARRGEAIGARRSGESITAWLARAHAGRRATDLLGTSPDDDIDDPTGSALADHHGTAEEIARATDAIVGLLWPDAAR